MQMRYLSCFVLLIIVVGCKSSRSAESLGEKHSSYTYVPIDPMPVWEEEGRSCTRQSDFKELLESLPDQAVRFSTLQTSGVAAGSFGSVETSAKGETFVATLDYINVDVAQVPVYVKRIPLGDTTGKSVSLYGEYNFRTRFIVSNAPRVNPDKKSQEDIEKLLPRKSSDGGELIWVPVFVGIGIRLTATVTSLKADAKLSSLPTIGAEASAERLTGSLTVQTLGITGDKVTRSLPLPSEIDETTVNNAILGLGSIKSILNDTNNVSLEPRVVGFYNPIGGGKDFVNGVISQFAKTPVTWYRPCKNKKEVVGGE